MSQNGLLLHYFLAPLNGKPPTLVHCLYQMSPLNHKRIASSLAPAIFHVTKKMTIQI